MLLGTNSTAYLLHSQLNLRHHAASVLQAEALGIIFHATADFHVKYVLEVGLHFGKLPWPAVQNHVAHLPGQGHSTTVYTWLKLWKYACKDGLIY